MPSTSFTALVLNWEIIPLTEFYGRVTVEEPAHVGNVRFWGDCQIGAFTYFSASCEVSDASVGRYCSMGQQTLIGPGEHAIEFVSSHLTGSDASGIVAGLHSSNIYKSFALTNYSRPQTRRKNPVIGHDVWIGARAVGGRGVTIGDGAVVGAGSLVTADVEPYSIVAGSPARKLRMRFPGDLIKRLVVARWWDKDLSLMVRRDFSDPMLFLNDLDSANLPVLKPHSQVFENRF